MVGHKYQGAALLTLLHWEVPAAVPADGSDCFLSAPLTEVHVLLQGSFSLFLECLLVYQKLPEDHGFLVCSELLGWQCSQLYFQEGRLFSSLAFFSSPHWFIAMVLPGWGMFSQRGAKPSAGSSLLAGCVFVFHLFTPTRQSGPGQPLSGLLVAPALVSLPGPQLAG